MKHTIKQTLLTTVLGAGLLSVSLSSSAYKVMAFHPEPRPTFSCAAQDELCLQERKPYQVFAIKNWKTRVETKRAEWYAAYSKKNDEYLAEQRR